MLSLELAKLLTEERRHRYFHPCRNGWVLFSCDRRRHPNHVTYVSNGERLFVESCNIRDLSDNASCMVVHPDKMRPNCFPTSTYETRGTLKKLLPTCQQPSAKAVARVQDAQKKDQAQYNAAVNPPAPPKPAASAPQVTAMNINPSAQSPSQRAAMRCITAGRSPMLCGENGLGKWFQGVLGKALRWRIRLRPVRPICCRRPPSRCRRGSKSLAIMSARAIGGFSSTIVPPC